MVVGSGSLSTILSLTNFGFSSDVSLRSLCILFWCFSRLVLSLKVLSQYSLLYILPLSSCSCFLWLSMDPIHVPLQPILPSKPFWTFCTSKPFFFSMDHFHVFVEIRVFTVCSISTQMTCFVFDNGMNKELFSGDASSTFSSSALRLEPSSVLSLASSTFFSSTAFSSSFAFSFWPICTQSIE